MSTHVQPPRVLNLVRCLFGDVMPDSTLYKIPQALLINYLRGMCAVMESNGFDSQAVPEKDLKFVTLIQAHDKPDAVFYNVVDAEGLPQRIMQKDQEMPAELKEQLEHVDHAIRTIAKGFQRYCTDRCLRGFVLVAYRAGELMSSNVMPIVTSVLLEDLAVLEEIQESLVVQRATQHFLNRRLTIDDKVNAEIYKAGLVPQLLTGEHNRVLIAPDGQAGNVIPIGKARKLAN